MKKRNYIVIAYMTLLTFLMPTQALQIPLEINHQTAYTYSKRGMIACTSIGVLAWSIERYFGKSHADAACQNCIVENNTYIQCSRHKHAHRIEQIMIPLTYTAITLSLECGIAAIIAKYHCKK